MCGLHPTSSTSSERVAEPVTASHGGFGHAFSFSSNKQGRAISEQNINNISIKQHGLAVQEPGYNKHSSPYQGIYPVRTTHPLIRKSHFGQRNPSTGRRRPEAAVPAVSGVEELSLSSTSAGAAGLGQAKLREWLNGTVFKAICKSTEPSNSGCSCTEIVCSVCLLFQKKLFWQSRPRKE